MFLSPQTMSCAQGWCKVSALISPVSFQVPLQTS